MKILVTDGQTAVRKLLRELARSGKHEITHCAGDARELSDLLSQKYDCAIISACESGEGELDATGIIRTLSQCAAGENAAILPSPLRRFASRRRCGVEWTKDGILELHCGLHTALQEDAQEESFINSVGDVLFEYHAPCKKTGGRGV